MTRKLTVGENYITGAYHFAVEPHHPDFVDRFGDKGYMIIGGPDDDDLGWLCDRRLGVFATNEEAIRAAERYAAEHGVVIRDKWQVTNAQSASSEESDLMVSAAGPRHLMSYPPESD
jgi:hypothetical protein